jgi:hypothetical protein
MRPNGWQKGGEKTGKIIDVQAPALWLGARVRVRGT